MDPKKNIKQIARRMLLCQHRTMTRDIRQVVTSITVITAKPAQEEKEAVIRVMTTDR